MPEKKIFPLPFINSMLKTQSKQKPDKIQTPEGTDLVLCSEGRWRPSTGGDPFINVGAKVTGKL